MYIGPWQELRLGQLLNDHKRLMEQSVHQQLQILKQQQLIHSMQQEQEQQHPYQLPALSPPAQLHTARQHSRVPPLPSAFSIEPSRSNSLSHPYQTAYVPSFLRDLSTVSTVSNTSSTTTGSSSSLVHSHHSSDPYPLPPLPPLSRASPPTSRRRLAGAAPEGAQQERRKKSARATKEQVAADRRQQVEKMRRMYGLNGGKQDEEHKEQEVEAAYEPALDEAIILPMNQYQQQQSASVTVPPPRRQAAADVSVISADDNQPDPLLPDDTTDYIPPHHQARPQLASSVTLPDLSSARLQHPTRSTATIEPTVRPARDSPRSGLSDATNRTLSPHTRTAASQRAVPAAISPPDANAIKPSLPLSPLSAPIQPAAPPTAAAPTSYSRPASLDDANTAAPPSTWQRVASLSEEDYLRDMDVNRTHRRTSLEAEDECHDNMSRVDLDEMQRQLAQYDIVVRPKTAQLLTQLMPPSTPLRASSQLSATMPSVMRSLALEPSASPLQAADINASRSLLQAVQPFAPDGSTPQAGSKSRSVTPPALAPIAQSPATTTKPAAPRSLSLFARHPPSASPSASPPARPSIEMSLQARRSIALEPLASVEGRERRGSSVEDEEGMEEVNTALLETETEKLLSFVNTASELAL